MNERHVAQEFNYEAPEVPPSTLARAREMNLFYTILMIGVIATLTGCGLMPPAPKQMYGGQPVSRSQVAAISEGARLWRAVVAIDGEDVINPALGAGPPTKGLLVLPGHHEITVRFLNLDRIQGSAATFAKGDQKVQLTAEAGHSYVLQTERLGETWRAWFDDHGPGYNDECLTAENYVKVVMKGERVAGCN